MISLRCTQIRNDIIRIRTWDFWGCLGGSVGQVSDFGSGHDLTAHGFAWSLLQILASPSLCAPPPLMLSFSLSKTNIKNKFRKNPGFLNWGQLSFLWNTLL